MKKKVSTVIVVDGKKFLILQRSKTSSGSGLWNFPGGSVEKDESTSVAACRELFEEAALKCNPDDLDYIGKLETKYLDVSFYITDSFSGEVEINRESQDYKWITLSEIDNYKFVSGGELHPDLVFEIGKFIYGG